MPGAIAEIPDEQITSVVRQDPLLHETLARLGSIMPNPLAGFSRWMQNCQLSLPVAARFPYQIPESLMLRFWLRKST
jgi:hypothetical protein